MNAVSLIAGSAAMVIFGKKIMVPSMAKAFWQSRCLQDFLLGSCVEAFTWSFWSAINGMGISRAQWTTFSQTTGFLSVFSKAREGALGREFYGWT
jgi:hypothetical protein